MAAPGASGGTARWLPLVGRSLFWRIYLTLLASLVLAAMLMALPFTIGGGNAVGPWTRIPVRLLEAGIPPPDAPADVLQGAVSRLAAAVNGDVTLLDADGRTRTHSSVDLARGRVREPREWDGRHGSEVWAFPLQDGRTLLARFGLGLRKPLWHILLLLTSIAVCVGIAATPLVARLTQRLERLRDGVERWGGGDLAARVPASGGDEIAAVAASFNRAADRIQRLLGAHRALLANASHELRSPLARLSVAIELWEGAPSAARRSEIARNLAELNLLIDEILLASRLDYLETQGRAERVDLLALAAEEAARTGATVCGPVVETVGDPRLLRRLLRNLLENAAGHGAPPVEIVVATRPDGGAQISVQDRGAGMPEAERERIFEPFYRPSGRGESAGGWGLGLALVRQIADLHGGRVRCEMREGGGSAFIVDLPATASV